MANIQDTSVKFTDQQRNEALKVLEGLQIIDDMEKAENLIDLMIGIADNEAWDSVKTGTLKMALIHAQEKLESALKKLTGTIPGVEGGQGNGK